MVALFKIQRVRFIEEKVSFKQVNVSGFLTNLESLVRSKLKFSRASPNTVHYLRAPILLREQLRHPVIASVML